MNSFEIFIAYISWQGGGKRRPVLCLSQDSKSVYVFRITSRYEEKSEAIRSKYFRINDWLQAGLNQQSYIDTGSKRELPLDTINETVPIGHLTENDKKRLYDFLA